MKKGIQVKIDGHLYTIKQLAKKYHISVSTIEARHLKHQRGKELIRPTRSKQRVQVHGKKMTFKQLAKKYHIPEMRLRDRYYLGYQGNNLVNEKSLRGIHAIVKGKVYNLHQLKQVFHIKSNTLKYRYYVQHKRDEDLVVDHKKKQPKKTVTQNKSNASHSTQKTANASQDTNNVNTHHVNFMSLEKSIQVLEKVTNVRFSKEQLQILKADYQHPIVVNACAGSGKTTIFVYRAILSMMTGQSNGHDTLGITFSKAAQLEMQKHYYTLKNQIIESGVRSKTLMDSYPQFMTFHALFLRLLRKYNHNLKVLANVNGNQEFMRAFYRILYQSHYDMDDKEVLKQIFALRNELINRGWSNDGLNIPAYKDASNPIKAVAPQLSIPSHTDKFYNDYLKVIRCYRDMKQVSNLVDFTDMKVLLYRQMTNDEQARKFYLGQMRHQKYVYLDEFQDIDNLQWQLIKKLLSPKAQKSLFVIGDDDQAIYGFRGGSAKYIINFQQDYPRARHFHLSTNYRTDEKVLNVARPMIKNNPVRIDKRLNAYHHEHSKIYVYHNNKHTTIQSDPIFTQLLNLAQNPHIANNEAVVLVRHNATRSMIADFLANHKIYPNISHDEYILQHNKIYTTYLDLMYALLHNDFDELYRHTTKIGFRQYRNHIKEVIYQHDLRLYNVHDLSTYNRLSNATRGNQEDEQIDRKIRNYYNLVQRQPKNTPKQVYKLLSDLYYDVHELVSSYYGYMVSKKFISQNDYRMAINSLKNNLMNYQYASADDFFTNEKYKAQCLNEVLNDQRTKSLDILTLHQAKGLQYPYVFLIGLDDTDFPSDSSFINVLFPSNCTYKEFLMTLYEHQAAFVGDAYQDDRYYQEMEKVCHHIWHMSKNQDEKLIPASAFDKVYELVVNKKYPPKHNSSQVHYINKNHYVISHGAIGEIDINTDDKGNRVPPIIQYIDRETGEILPIHKYMSKDKINKYYNQIKSIYRDIIHCSKFVESERRLLYVGITRSQKQLYLDIPDSPSPLLSELNLHHGIKETTLNKNKTISPTPKYITKLNVQSSNDKSNKAQKESLKNHKSNKTHKSNSTTALDSLGDFSIDQISKAVNQNSINDPNDNKSK